ncbi:hypothetical protein BKA82DRAFT_2440229 [Pisolithus tinctorius]|nr:hypothetical protein BKA82DRAFT_2440229 [Pisolithus tinctorius]
MIFTALLLLMFSLIERWEKLSLRTAPGRYDLPLQMRAGPVSSNFVLPVYMRKTHSRCIMTSMPRHDILLSGRCYRPLYFQYAACVHSSGLCPIFSFIARIVILCQRNAPLEGRVNFPVRLHECMSALPCDLLLQMPTRTGPIHFMFAVKIGKGLFRGPEDPPPVYQGP